LNVSTSVDSFDRVVSLGLHSSEHIITIHQVLREYYFTKYINILSYAQKS
jgi:hypothetical protein